MPSSRDPNRESPEALSMRMRAAVEASSEPVTGDVPDETRSLLHEVAGSVGPELAQGPTGVAPVLGAGVLATVIGQVRQGKDAELAQPPGSRLDTRG
jgi:hypothetical protein